MGDERIGAAVPDLDRLVDERVGLGGLLGDGVESVLEDLALSAGMVAQPSPARPCQPLLSSRRSLRRR